MAKPSRTISFLYPDCIVSGLVSGVRGSIITIRKHSVSQKTLAGGGVGVCVNESAQGGGVISALQVVESGLFDKGLSLSAIWGGFLFGKIPNKWKGKTSISPGGP